MFEEIVKKFEEVFSHGVGEIKAEIEVIKARLEDAEKSIAALIHAVTEPTKTENPNQTTLFPVFPAEPLRLVTEAPVAPEAPAAATPAVDAAATPEAASETPAT